MPMIDGKQVDIHDFLENDGVECRNCGMEISGEE